MMKKSFLTVCLVISTIINVLFINTVKISAFEISSVNKERGNYNFIETENVDNIHYTYEESGQTYHVYEKIGDDFSYFETKVCVVDSGKKKVLEEYTTYIRKDGDSVYLDKYMNDERVEEKLISQVNTNTTRYTTPYNGRVYYEARTNRYFTGWWYAYTDERYNNIKNLSLTAVAIIVATVVGAELSNPDISIEIYDAAKAFIDANVEVLYWYQDVYEVYQIHYPERTFYGTFIGQRVYTTVYADESKTRELDNFVYEYLSPTEWPSITIGPA